MQRRTGIIIGIILGLGILVGLGLLGVIVYVRAPAGGGAAANAIPATMFVTLTQPFDGSHPSLGEPIPVAAEAVGLNPVQSLELWADGELVNRTNSQMPELKQLNGFWNWTPTSEGSHTLMTRGFDSNGQMALSNSVRVNVGPPPPVNVPVVPKVGDTLYSLAAEYNISPFEAADANPEIDPTAPLAVNQPVMIPFKSWADLPPGWSIPPSPEIPANPTDLIPPPPEPPGGQGGGQPPLPPKLTAKVEGCNIIATISSASDDADTFLLYLGITHGIGEGQAEVVGESGPLATGEKYVKTMYRKKGDYVLIAEATNAAGSVESIPLNVSVTDDTCKFDPVSGDVKIFTAKNVERLYCFATINQKDIPRIPMVPDSKIHPMSQKAVENWKKQVLPDNILAARQGFDLTPYLQPLMVQGKGATLIRFECWDWVKQKSIGIAEKSLSEEEMGKYTVITGDNYSVVGIFGIPNPGNQKFLTIPPPKNLRTTEELNLCKQHASSQYKPEMVSAVCGLMINGVTKVLVWDGDYSKNNIDGYRLYRYVLGEPSLLKTVSIPDQTLTFIEWPGDNICFTVRAYKGLIESGDSNLVCVDGKQADPNGVKTVTFKPTRLSVTCNTNDFFFNGNCAGFKTGEFTQGPITVGHFYSKMGFGNPTKIYEASGSILFENLQEVVGKPILSAKLFYTMTNSYYSMGSIASNEFVCPKSLSAVDQFNFYLGGQQVIHSYNVIKQPPNQRETKETVVDVTDVVKGWAQNQNNGGFLLFGGNSFPYLVSLVCGSTYDDFRMEISYINNP